MHCHDHSIHLNLCPYSHNGPLSSCHQLKQPRSRLVNVLGDQCEKEMHSKDAIELVQHYHHYAERLVRVHLSVDDPGYGERADGTVHHEIRQKYSSIHLVAILKVHQCLHKVPIVEGESFAGYPDSGHSFQQSIGLIQFR